MKNEKQKIPICNQVDLLRADARIARPPKRVFDDEGHERGERRNGGVQCPECELWWPTIEEPDAWTLDESTGKWNATGWWGGTVCELCSLLLVEQPDGRAEVYRLGAE